MRRILAMGLLLVGCTSTRSTTQPSESVSLDTSSSQQDSFVAPRGTSGQQGLINRTVRIFFRRDALGYAGPVPLDPVLASTGGRSMTVEGVVRSVEPNWLTLEGTNGQIRVIRGDAILLVEVLP